MTDLDRNFFLGELLARYRRQKEALLFHLGIRKRRILTQWLDENTELVVVVRPSKRTEDDDVNLAKALAAEREDADWKRYLKIFRPTKDTMQLIESYMHEADQDWKWGLSALEHDPQRAVQSMLNAISLLAQCLGIYETNLAKNHKEYCRMNSVYGGKVKAARFNGIKDEVIRLLAAGSWKSKAIAIDDIVKNLRPYIDTHGWPSAQDKNATRDDAEIEAELVNLLKAWSKPNGDKEVNAAFVEAVKK